MTFARYQAVPLALNAAEKLEEAGYFFNHMLALRLYPRQLVYNLSAFLSALRSITDNHLPQQFSKHPRFHDWFDGRRAENEADPILVTLVRLRIDTVHRYPVKEIYYEAGPPIPAEGILTSHFEWTHELNQSGRMVCKFRTSTDAAFTVADPLVKWVFRLPEEREVFVTCRYGLEKMHSMLRDWDTILKNDPALER